MRPISESLLFLFKNLYFFSDVVYNISMHDFSVLRSIEWPSSKGEVEDCLMKGKPKVCLVLAGTMVDKLVLFVRYRSDTTDSRIALNTRFRESSTLYSSKFSKREKKEHFSTKKRGTTHDDGLQNEYLVGTRRLYMT